MMIMHNTGTREDRLAARLGLAAAPTFAVMALLTAVSGNPDMGCLTANDASPLSGMATMYLLMSAFHLAPWLTLASSWRNRASRS